jgi:hypothetical protein
MKKLTICALLVLCSIASAQSFHQLTINWTNPNSLATNGWQPCAFTATPPIATVCVQGFTLEDTTIGASPVVLSPSCSATVTTNCLSPASTSFVVTPLPAVGSHSYALVTNGLNSTGAALNSTPANVTVQVPTASPSPTPLITIVIQ